MFGLFEILLGYVRKLIGGLSDAASATGSVLARLKYIIDTSIPAVQYPRGYGAATSYSTTGTSYATALDITGRGRLLGFMIYKVATSGASYLKITVDGTAIEYTVYAAAGTYGCVKGPGDTVVESLANYGRFKSGELDFNTSLKIEVKSGESGKSTAVYYAYSAE